MILTFEDDTQIEVNYDDISNVWKIAVLNEGTASQILYNCDSKGTLFSSDIFSIESKLQGIRHIK
jgi:hypothetical protein